MKRLLIIGILFLASCGGEGGPGGIGRSEWNDEVRDNLNGLGIANEYSLPREFRYTTPAGAIVESVVSVPPSALAAIDRGLQRRIDRFAIMAPLWTAARDIRGTRVLFIHPNRLTDVDGTIYPPCELESIPGAPCFYVQGIKTAGTVLGTDDRWSAIDLDPPIVLPHQASGNWQWLDYLAAAAHNEDEHRAGWLARHQEPTGIFYRFLGYNDAHPQQFGETDVPYLFTDALGQLIPQIPHGCIAE